MTAAELEACSDEEIAERFARPLTFGTAGLRGPMRGGPNGMNLAVVMRTTWAVAQVLKDRDLSDSRVVVGGDARHGSEQFALAAAEVLAAQGFHVTLMFAAVPTPAIAFGARHLSAAAGIQITASHNPPSDNGYKVYFDGGLQIVPPTDREIETLIGKAPHADEIPRAAVDTSGVDLIQRYVDRAAHVRHTHGSVRLAFSAMHGVGGEYALDAFVRAGLSDVQVVESQFAPDPDFPTVPFPNPEEPGAADELLKLAADAEAEVAIALDPDADRCAVGVPTPDGWRMLTGDETGWLLGDYVLSQIEPGEVSEHTVVASSVVSSRMLAAIAAAHGARHVETLTGFKWLSRADADLPGCTLVYAYEEAIGYCVDPSAVRDKDGISAAVLFCDMVVALREQGRTVLDALDDLARRHGVHATTAVARPVVDADEAAEVMTRLRSKAPTKLCGFDITMTDLAAVQPVSATHRRGDPRRRRHRHRSAGGGPAVGHRAESQVLHRGSANLRRRRSGCRPSGRPTAPGGVGRNRRQVLAALARPELPVACVAEPGHDVGDVVEAVVDGRGEQRDVGCHLLQRRNALRSHHDANRRDVNGFAGMQQSDGVRHRATGGEHRVEHEHRLGAQVVGQGLQIRRRLVGLFVARDTDEPDAGLRDQRMRLIDHAEPGAQHRHQQRRIGQARSGGFGERRANRDGFGRRIAGCLVHQHQCQVAQGVAECRVVRALVAQCGQPRRGQRVVDDAHVHGPTLVTIGTARRSSPS